MVLSTAAVSLFLATVVHGATVSVNPQTKYQQYDGTGCSEAFQRSLLVYNLEDSARTEVLDYLFTEKGAGFTILRNGIGSTPNQPFDFMKSIAPTAPASNDSEVRRSLPQRISFAGRLTLLLAQLHPAPTRRPASTLAHSGGEGSRSEIRLCRCMECRWLYEYDHAFRMPECCGGA